jgi:zinc transporter ZupT
MAILKMKVNSKYTISLSRFECELLSYAKLKQRRNTGVPLVNLPVEDDDEKTSDASSKSKKKKEKHDSHHGKQDWKKVDMVAWILLLCISIECLIEGIGNGHSFAELKEILFIQGRWQSLSLIIPTYDPWKAFALTLTDELGAGIAILTAMIIKLIPQKLGDAVILSKAGLNHFWENLLSLGAVSFVFVGKKKK